MKNRYCGSCHGERGCKDCKTAFRRAGYESLTGFSLGLSKGEFFEKQAEVCGDTLLFAADIGTTTLAFAVTDKNGTVLAAFGTENPQRESSADVIGRIDAACHGKAEELKNQIREALAKGFLFVHERAASVVWKKGIRTKEKDIRIAVAGNTVMQHLLLGYPVNGLTGNPFTPYSIEAVTVSFEELFGTTTVYESFPAEMKRAAVFVFPGMSAFVGGDVVAGGYGLFGPAAAGQEEKKPGGVYLLADLGTNGELLLWKNGRLYAAAAAMGCAFEGGRFAYASELFALVAEALKEGAADETGLLAEPYFSEGFCGLSQEDIRDFQLAKGAVRAGIELLCKRAELSATQIEEVYLAGGAGRFCREEDLFRTGLLPETFRGKLHMVGNSCIGGLLRYLKNPEDVLQWKGEVLNLAEEPEFEALYYHFMEFREERSEEG